MEHQKRTPLTPCWNSGVPNKMNAAIFERRLALMSKVKDCWFGTCSCWSLGGRPSQPGLVDRNSKWADRLVSVLLSWACRRAVLRCPRVQHLNRGLKRYGKPRFIYQEYTAPLKYGRPPWYVEVRSRRQWNIANWRSTIRCVVNAPLQRKNCEHQPWTIIRSRVCLTCSINAAW